MSHIKPNSMKKTAKGNVVATTFEFPMYKKNEKTFGQILYDGQDGTVLGRTPASWVKIIFFYSIFYAALGAMSYVYLKLVMSTLNDKEPKYMLGESLIGTHPGVGFRPIPDEVEQGSLIWYDSSSPAQIKRWTNLLDDFLEEYKKKENLPNQKHCTFDNLPNEGQVCRQDLDSFKSCSPEFAYGYNNSAPCIFLKVNRIIGWEPQYYNDTNDLPEEMPSDLKKHIKSISVKERNQIWVSCRGEEASDRESIGEIKYYPSRGFPSFFYPYRNTNGYMSPLVAVKFTRPRSNQIINIECRTWAKNIKYIGSHRDRMGSVHLELMVDTH